jgi:hypothetical protein
VFEPFDKLAYSTCFTELDIVVERSPFQPSNLPTLQWAPISISVVQDFDLTPHDIEALKTAHVVYPKGMPSLGQKFRYFWVEKIDEEKTLDHEIGDELAFKNLGKVTLIAQFEPQTHKSKSFSLYSGSSHSLPSSLVIYNEIEVQKLVPLVPTLTWTPPFPSSIGVFYDLELSASELIEIEKSRLVVAPVVEENSDSGGLDGTWTLYDVLPTSNHKLQLAPKYVFGHSTSEAKESSKPRELEVKFTPHSKYKGRYSETTKRVPFPLENPPPGIHKIHNKKLTRIMCTKSKTHTRAITYTFNSHTHKHTHTHTHTHTHHT